MCAAPRSAALLLLLQRAPLLLLLLLLLLLVDVERECTEQQRSEERRASGTSVDSTVRDSTARCRVALLVSIYWRASWPWWRRRTVATKLLPRSVRAMTTELLPRSVCAVTTSRKRAGFNLMRSSPACWRLKRTGCGGAGGNGW